MKRDSQNLEDPNEPPPIENGTDSEDKYEPNKDSYYYDDATGYEVYRDSEDEDESSKPPESKPSAR
ncbi:MAG: hypothetical protein AABM67_00480 [Acidobacteriota bacterium]